MNQYEVYCVYRNAGDQGILHLGQYVTVEAEDEHDARMKCIDVVHQQGNYEHVTPKICNLISGEQP